jgi:tetrahedral aminopeptidase
MLELVKKLAETFGVSGNEEDIRNLIKNEIAAFVDEISVDALGNLIAVRKGKGKRLMVAAHMDELGLMATYADEKGFIRFAPVGSIGPFALLGQRVKFRNGVIGVVYYEEKLDDLKNLKLSRMYIDIGANSREEAMSRIRLGDTACLDVEPRIQGNRILSKALNNRAGCAVAIETMKRISGTEHEIYFVFTVQEELGSRGARTAAFGIKPDAAIELDVTPAGDTPDGEAKEIRCGGGPGVKIMDAHLVSHPELRRHLETCAAELQLPVQLLIQAKGSGDGSEIHLTAGGIPTVGLSIPCRYVRNPVEIVYAEDLGNTVKLLTAAIHKYQ